MNVATDPFFWFTLLFGIILLCQLIGAALFAPSAFRAYRSLKSIQDYKRTSTLREKLGPIR